MKRRAFISLIAGAAATTPITARAQQTGTMRRIGILMGLPESDTQGRALVEAFRQGLRELNWIEGENVHLNIRWDAGRETEATPAALELVRLAPDVLVGSNSAPARALKQATQTIPIIFTGVSDPVGDGIVPNLSNQGGNVTGFASFNAPLAGKWLQFLKEFSPEIKRVSVIYNPDTARLAIFMPALEAAALSIGLKLEQAVVRDPVALEAAVIAMAREPRGGSVFLPDVFIARHRQLLYALTTQHKIPTIYGIRYHAVDGALMSYGPDFVDQHRRAAAYVDRVLRGAQPADLPIQQPTKFELVINAKTAKAIGLTIPPTLLAFADEVIE